MIPRHSYHGTFSHNPMVSCQSVLLSTINTFSHLLNLLRRGQKVLLLQLSFTRFRSALRPAATSSHSDFNTYVEKQHWLPASTSTPPPAESDRHDAVGFSEYICGSADDKRRVAGTLLDSLRQNGYARLRYHGIHASVVGEAFDLVSGHFQQDEYLPSQVNPS